MRARLAVFATLTLFCAACNRKPDAPQPARQRDASLIPPTPADAVNPKPESNATSVPMNKKTSASDAPLLRGKISFQDIARYPTPGSATPHSYQFSPDGKHLTYLKSEAGNLVYELFALNLETGEEVKLSDAPEGGESEENLSLEEKLRRERSRTRSLGITRYTWSGDAQKMLVPLTGDLYIKSGLDGPLTKILDTDGNPAIDARWSPDETKIAFVQDGELHVLDANSGAKPKALTKGARESGKIHATAEYIAQEEMGRSTGYWWSEDSKWIAYTEVDETHIPEYRIIHQGSDGVGEGAQENHRYPFAGKQNAHVRLGVVSANGGRTRWIDLGRTPEDDFYLARVNWLPDGSLVAQLQNREQTELELRKIDPKTGRSSTFLRETSEVWINLHNMLKPIEKGEHAGEIVWASEKTGFRHLYLINPNGETIRPLTSGNWQVDHIDAIDEEKQKIWFTATKDDVTQAQLYEIGFDGGEPRKVTGEAGYHHVVIDESYERFVDIYSAIDQQPVITLRKLSDGSVIRELFRSDDPQVKALDLTPPRIVKIDSRDGETLYGTVYTPDPKAFGPGPYPTIVSVYGGPHAQRVVNSWSSTASMREQLLRQNGYLVLKLDNRGSARRGLAFEGKIRHDLGNIEVQDQQDGVRWLASEGLADPKRVGIFGWSYGGYMSAMSVARAPETFKVGIAGAPVTHWDGYDTHYTERYMGLPDKNKKGYEQSSVMAHVEKMEGKLLLVHGLIDENVHFRHTARLMNALVEADKDFELLLYPDARHMPRKEADRQHMERKIMEFIRENL